MVVLRGVVSYPTPLYRNPDIEPQYYEPSRFVISAITRGPTTLITTSVAHNYVIGQEVRLLIPWAYGSYQLNETKGFVIDVPSTTQVTVLINSVNADAFIASPTVPLGQSTQEAQILAIGDVNTGIINSHGRIMQGTYILGSFINISPL